MKVNLKDIQIKKDKIIFDNEEYDNFGLKIQELLKFLNLLKTKNNSING